jgi:stearoyl-CoA desaturase (delta-9 desaturase)
VLAKYATLLKRTYTVELRKLRRLAPQEAHALQTVEPWLDSDDKMLHEAERARLAEVLPKSQALQTMVSMRRELAAIWGRSMASTEQLVRQLQDWCWRAEASGIAPLAEFSQRLRTYA